jgi:uncharacterized protein with PQ loop repeat
MSSFIEIQNWGWNVATFGFIGTLFFTLVQGTGVVKQTWKIWEGQSGESVSMPIVAFMTVSQMAFTGYGWTQSSLAIILNGLLFIPFGMETITIGRFKGVDRLSRWVLRISPIFIPILLYAPKEYLGGVMSVGMFITCILIFKQLKEIRQSPNRGNLDIYMLGCMTGGSVFWTTFGLAVGNVVISVFSPIFLFEWIAIMVIWYRKPPAPVAAIQ